MEHAEDAVKDNKESSLNVELVDTNALTSSVIMAMSLYQEISKQNHTAEMWPQHVLTEKSWLVIDANFVETTSFQTETRPDVSDLSVISTKYFREMDLA